MCFVAHTSLPHHHVSHFPFMKLSRDQSGSDFVNWWQQMDRKWSIFHVALCWRLSASSVETLTPAPVSQLHSSHSILSVSAPRPGQREEGSHQHRDKTLRSLPYVLCLSSSSARTLLSSWPYVWFLFFLDKIPPDISHFTHFFSSTLSLEYVCFFMFSQPLYVGTCSFLMFVMYILRICMLRNDVFCVELWAQ